MINTNDSIRYGNVISKKYSFYYKDMERVLGDFKLKMEIRGLHPAGPLFYSLLNVPLDEKPAIEVFMPVEEDGTDETDDMEFHTYYDVEHMLSIIVAEHFETETEAAYSALLELMEQYSLVQTTPFYHIVMGDKSFRYVIIKVGYR